MFRRLKFNLIRIGCIVLLLGLSVISVNAEITYSNGSLTIANEIINKAESIIGATQHNGYIIFYPGVVNSPNYAQFYRSGGCQTNSGGTFHTLSLKSVPVATYGTSGTGYRCQSLLVSYHPYTREYEGFNAANENRYVNFEQGCVKYAANFSGSYRIDVNPVLGYISLRCENYHTDSEICNKCSKIAVVYLSANPALSRCERCDRIFSDYTSDIKIVEVSSKSAAQN